MSNAAPFDSPTNLNPPAKRGSGKFLVILFAILGSIGVLCCGGFLVFGYFMMGVGAQQLVSSFKSNPDVVNEIGGIDSASINFSATQTEQAKDPKSQVMVIDVKGSKGSGQIVLYMEPGKPEDFRMAKLRLPDGREIELVDADPDFEGPVPPPPPVISEESSVEAGTEDQ